MSDSTAQTPTPQITEEMIEAGAQAMAEADGYVWRPYVADETDESATHARTGRYLSRARVGLGAALAGRIVVELPAPSEVRADARFWRAEGRRIAASVDGCGRPFVLVDSQIWLVGEAEAVALAKLAAARESRRLASESSGDSDYPRFYRWGDSHFYRVDAPDRVRFRTDERNDWSASGVRTEAELLGASTATFERYHPEQS